MDELRNALSIENESLAQLESARRELLRVVDAVQNGYDVQLAAIETGVVRPQKGCILKEGSRKNDGRKRAQWLINRAADGYSFVMPNEEGTVWTMLEKKPVPVAALVSAEKPVVFQSLLHCQKWLSPPCFRCWRRRIHPAGNWYGSADGGSWCVDTDKEIKNRQRYE